MPESNNPHILWYINIVSFNLQSNLCVCLCKCRCLLFTQRGGERTHTHTQFNNLLFHKFAHNILSSSSSSSLSSMIAHLNWLFYYYINLIENQAFAVWQPVGRFAANWQTFAHARTHSSPSSSHHLINLLPKNETKHFAYTQIHLESNLSF